MIYLCKSCFVIHCVSSQTVMIHAFQQKRRGAVIDRILFTKFFPLKIEKKIQLRNNYKSVLTFNLFILTKNAESSPLLYNYFEQCWYK